MKKLLALALALVFAMTLLAGCGSASSANTSVSDSTAAEGGHNKPIKYTIMLKQSIAEYPPDGGEAKDVILKKLETDLGITNVDYEVILAAGSDYATKLNAMLSAGDVPDFFEIDITMIKNLVANGVIAPIDDFIAMMPNYQKVLECDEVARNTIKSFSVDGKAYAFPTAVRMPGYPMGINNEGLILRTDWLDTLGLSTPKTLEDLHNVLKSFTFDDPDKNGKNDTYGLSGHKEQYFGTVFGAYGIYLKEINSWMERGGKLEHSTTRPETKQALSTLRDWYAEGIIDPDKFVIEGKQVKDKFSGGQVGAYEGTIWWANDARVAWSTSNPTATCGIMTPVQGPDGKQGYPVPTEKAIPRVVSQNCVENKNPEILMKIMDWMLDDSAKGGLRLVQYGVEGVHYNYDAENDFIDQSLITDYADLYRAGYSNPVRWLGVMDNRWIAPEDPRTADLKITNDDSTWVRSEFLGSVPALKTYPDLYNKLWAEYFTKIVTGALPIEAFDEYVEEFYAQGGSELTEEVNEAWKQAKA